MPCFRTNLALVAHLAGCSQLLPNIARCSVLLSLAQSCSVLLSLGLARFGCVWLCGVAMRVVLCFGALGSSWCCVVISSCCSVSSVCRRPFRFCLESYRVSAAACSIHCWCVRPVLLVSLAEACQWEAVAEVKEGPHASRSARCALSHRVAWMGEGRLLRVAWRSA